MYLFSGISSHYFPVLHDWVAEMQNETSYSKIHKMRRGKQTDKIPQKTTFTCLDTTGVLVSGEEHVNVAGFTVSA